MQASKHQENSAKTREKIIQAAENLYGTRGIAAVSLAQITAAAGQKNRNALQYHFGNRSALLQAIVDKHAARVAVIREAYLQRAESQHWPSTKAAARCLIMPLVDYVEAEPSAINYVRVISQLLTTQEQDRASKTTLVRFAKIPALSALLNQAMHGLSAREIERRAHLAANVAFHSIADIYRNEKKPARSSALSAKKPMIEQLECMLEAFFSADSRTK